MIVPETNVRVNPTGDEHVENGILLVNGDFTLPVYVSEVLVRVNILGQEQGDLVELNEFVSDINSGLYEILRSV